MWIVFWKERGLHNYRAFAEWRAMSSRVAATAWVCCPLWSYEQLKSALWMIFMCIYLLSCISHSIHSTTKEVTFILHTSYSIFSFLINMSKDWLTKRWMRLQKEDRVWGICLYMPHPHPRKCVPWSDNLQVTKSYEHTAPNPSPASVIFEDAKSCFPCIWVSIFHTLGSYPFC